MIFCAANVSAHPVITMALAVSKTAWAPCELYTKPPSRAPIPLPTPRYKPENTACIMQDWLH